MAKRNAYPSGLVGAAIFVLAVDYASSVTRQLMSVIGLIFVLSVLSFRR